MLLLVGDSILDNHHWNGVGSQCTGDLLRTAMPDKTLNYSVEELTTYDWFRNKTMNLKLGGGVVDPFAFKKPEQVYVDSVRRMGVKSSYPKGVSLFPPLDNIDVVVISAGGNDLFLKGEYSLLWSVKNLVQRLEMIFEGYRRMYPHCKIIYVVPYKPKKISGIPTDAWYSKGWVDSLYAQLKSGISPKVDDMIDLSEAFVAGIHHADPGTGIPEPTVRGAKLLADLIQEKAEAFIDRK